MDNNITTNKNNRKSSNNTNRMNDSNKQGITNLENQYNPKVNKPQVNTNLHLPNTQSQLNKQKSLKSNSQQQLSPQINNKDIKPAQLNPIQNKGEEEEKAKPQPVIEVPQSQNDTIQIEQLKPRPPIIINELVKKNLFDSISKMTINFIYKREEYSIKIPPNKTLKHLRDIISSKLKLPIEDIELYYQNKLIDQQSMDTFPLNHFLKRKPYSYFEIRKKCNDSLLSSLNEIYNTQPYEHKVTIQNYPSMIDLSSHITVFFRETMQIKDIKIELIDNYSAVICFRSSALAFDFNRYLWYIKSQDPKWCQITSRVQLPQAIKKTIKLNPSHSTRNGNRKSIRQQIIPLGMLYHGMQSCPYMSLEERRMQEYKESKKKWISSHDFISSVGNYSMVQYKKFHPLI